jgi:MFS family permease
MDTAPTTPQAKAPLKVIVSLCAIVGGLQLAEEISNNVLPLTLRHFTGDAKLIGMILAIHPLFGFIAQPVVGILGDRIWTRVGRRAFFLVLCAPLSAICMLVMPHMPSLGQLVTVVVFFQLFLALLWGSDHPLITDLVPATQRTIVKGWMMASVHLCSFVFLRWGVGRSIDHFGEASVYQIAAAAQIVLIAFAALFLNETPANPAPRPKLTVRRYVGDLLGDPVLRKFALLGFVYSAFINIVVGFAVLFAVQTVGISKAAFGEAWSTQALLALVGAIPLGFLIERMPKQWAMAAGFAISLVGCGYGYFAMSPKDFYPVALLFGFGWMVVEVTLKPFFSEYLPRDIVGQLTGAYNICYAIGRITALVGAGWVVSLAGNNYRVIWLLALGFGVVSVVVAASIPDRRFGERRAAARAARRDALSLSPLSRPAE